MPSGVGSPEQTPSVNGEVENLGFWSAGAAGEQTLAPRPPYTAKSAEKKRTSIEHRSLQAVQMLEQSLRLDDVAMRLDERVRRQLVRAQARGMVVDLRDEDQLVGVRPTDERLQRRSAHRRSDPTTDTDSV